MYLICLIHKYENKPLRLKGMASIPPSCFVNSQAKLYEGMSTKVYFILMNYGQTFIGGSLLYINGFTAKKYKSISLIPK